MKSYKEFKTELPSNRKFGFFFTAVFLVASAYFHVKTNTTGFYTFGVLAVICLLVTIIKAELLLPLNKLWMRLGHLIGMFVSPIVLGFIFFGIFTPIGIIMRIFGRDELGLKFQKKRSYWIKRETVFEFNSFKNQF
jgi:membrane-bound ClpP family serine protease